MSGSDAVITTTSPAALLEFAQDLYVFTSFAKSQFLSPLFIHSLRIIA